MLLYGHGAPWPIGNRCFPFICVARHVWWIKVSLYMVEEICEKYIPISSRGIILYKGTVYGLISMKHAKSQANEPVTHFIYPETTNTIERGKYWFWARKKWIAALWYYYYYCRWYKLITFAGRGLISLMSRRSLFASTTLFTVAEY